MNALFLDEIMALIVQINEFVDSAESLIAEDKTIYEANKKELLKRHCLALSNLDNMYKENYTSVQTRASQIIIDAQNTLNEIEKLDEKLSKIDKYYVKTKKNREEFLSDTICDKYNAETDYFQTLGKIKETYNTLFKKYSVDILPSLINGLNYIFSTQRKKDYQELIILKNTATAFVKEIEEMLPQLAEENLSSLRKEYSTQRRSIIEKQRGEISYLENIHLNTLETIAEQICMELENILPDNLIDYIYNLETRYIHNLNKVNSTNIIQDDVLNMCYIEYNVDLFTESRIVASTIKEKCSKLLKNNSIYLPFAISTKNHPTWLIECDNTNNLNVQAFTHAIMYGFLSSCPVGRLTYTVIDPENRGNSIFPYFDAKKKLPKLFSERLYINRDDIIIKINALNDKIEDTIQNRLCNQYDTIFDYAKNVVDYDLNLELFIIYDFPKGFDERTLAELRNILRNGSRCGIYTIIAYHSNIDNSHSREYLEAVQSVVDLATVINQNNEDFILRGLPVSFHSMPDKNEFAKFFSKYMLIFEGIKNRGIAFSPLISPLIEARDSIELNERIELICNIMNAFKKSYAKVPEVNISFPSFITLGSVLYPSDIFSDSIGYQEVIAKFGIEKDADVNNSNFVELPFVFNLSNSFNLLLNYSETASNEVVAFTHHVIWNFLSSMPVTKANICIFDSEQRGNSIIPFLDFRKNSPDTFDQKIYTDQESMYERLRKINTQIDGFIQDKLGNLYKNILDYNLNSSNRSEPITLLIIYDFPSGMDGRSIDLLTNILRNGNKCGIFTIICYNQSITYSRYDNIDNRLEQISCFCASINYKNGHYVLLPYNLQINIPTLPDNASSNNFITDYIAKSETIKKQGLSFRDIISSELFSFSSARSLRIPVGIGDGDNIIHITVGESSSHHGLIAGATGSGKSTLLHTLIMSSMLHYSPDQLHMYLMDFKSGTEFKIYESVKLPHIQLLALDAMQEFGESILENLVSEMERRGSLFKSVGQTSIKGYVDATGLSLPRILVIMDEFQILFNDSTNRKVAMNCAELTKRIVTEGRAFGIHLLMATQSTKVISDLSLSHGTIEQMRIRIGLKCGENDARYLFSDQNDTKALEMMKGPIGTAVMNLDYTEQSNIGFRAAYCDDATQKYYLNLISETYENYPSRLQIFEGGRTTNLIDYFREAHIGLTEELPVRVHMGTLIKVAPPFTIQIDKKRKHNLLICGSNEKMADTISNNYIISALLNLNVFVYCIDGNILIENDESNEFYDMISNNCTRFTLAKNRKDIALFINDIYKVYQEKKKHNNNDIIFIVIKNLQFLDLVKSMFKGDVINENEFMDSSLKEEDTFNPADPFAAVNSLFASRSNDGNIPVNEKILKMIEDGSGFGIHFVVTSLEYQTVRECMYYGENILTKFPERIIFSLGANDADNLIENAPIRGLRDNTVYYTDGIKNTFQLKPYVLPNTNDIKLLFS